MTKKKLILINLESFIATLLVYVIFYELSPQKLKYFSLNIHPLVILVAIQSIRYGTLYSLPIVLYSILFYFLPYFRSGQDIFLFFTVYQYYKFILMFILINLILGRQKDKQDLKLILIKDARDRERREKILINRSNDNLTETQNILNKRIFESEASILALDHIETELSSCNNSDIFKKFLELLNKYTHCITVCFYKYSENDNLLIREEFIGESSFENTIDLKIAKKFFSDALKRKTPFEVVYEKNRYYLAPIFLKEKLYGIIHIEKSEYDYKDNYQLDFFTLLIEKLHEKLAKRGED